MKKKYESPTNRANRLARSQLPLIGIAGAVLAFAVPASSQGAVTIAKTSPTEFTVTVDSDIVLTSTTATTTTIWGFRFPNVFSVGQANTGNTGHLPTPNNGISVDGVTKDLSSIGYGINVGVLTPNDFSMRANQSFTSTVGGTFTLHAGTYTGALPDFVGGTLSQPTEIQVWVGGGAVAGTAIESIPEPSAGFMCLVGSAGILLRRRRAFAG